MATTRIYLMYCPFRLSLSVLFFFVMLISILLTLISLNKNVIRQGYQPYYRAQEVPMLVVHNSEIVSNESAARQNRLVTYPRYITNQRQSKILRLRNYKSKLFAMRYMQQQNRSHLKTGWNLLPGSVVVHTGNATINSHDFALLTNNIEACKGFFRSDGPRILIFVESDVRNMDRRNAIRETWALPMLQKTLNFKVVFMLGIVRTREAQEAINDEIYSYGDIVQENFTESFKHLALKSVMGLKWVQRYCPEADFVLKTDDDILIHVPNLINTLSDYVGTKRVLLCHKNRSRQIIRHGGGGAAFVKYQVLPAELPGSFFPAYCGGFAYLMSRDTVHLLYAASLTTPYFFIEDVYVTGFCRHKAGVEFVDHPNIVLKPYVTSADAPCSFDDGRITSQELTADEMKAIWRMINTRGFFCPVPITRETTRAIQTKT